MDIPIDNVFSILQFLSINDFLDTIYGTKKSHYFLSKYMAIKNDNYSIYLLAKHSVLNSYIGFVRFIKPALTLYQIGNLRELSRRHHDPLTYNLIDVILSSP